MSFWVAVPPVLLTIGLIYFTFYRMLKALYRDHLEWFLGAIIFLCPFGYVLSQASTLVNLMWILLLTPFYAIFVLLVSTTWVLQFYLGAFATLLIFTFIRNIRSNRKPTENPQFEDFLKQNLQGRSGSLRGKDGNIGKIVKKTATLTHKVSKSWSIVVAVILLIILSTTFVSAANPTNPTYSQVQKFIATDQTNTHPYAEGSYTCINFATDFRNNALKAGYKCGFVVVYFPDNQTHVLDCFNTTDSGLVFVEPQWEKIVNVAVGQPYRTGNFSLAIENSTVLSYYVDFQNPPQLP